MGVVSPFSVPLVFPLQREIACTHKALSLEIEKSVSMETSSVPYIHNNRSLASLRLYSFQLDI